MKSNDLYRKLDTDFRLSECHDEWSDYGDARFVAQQFQQRFTGLFLDNTPEILQVYTAVFPSRSVLNEMYDREASEALLLVHHPMTWDIRLSPTVFQPIPMQDMEMLRQRRIAIYALHTPLDRNGPYSTSVTLAAALGLEVVEELNLEYFGVRPCVVGKTDCRTLDELSQRYTEVVGHRTSKYAYGEQTIRNGCIVVGAGGGNIPEVIQQVANRGGNVYITGITALNDFSRPAHQLADENSISLLGGTHYSTEKFACMAICDYFKKLGLRADFLGDSPVLEDL
jgi:putative NIF3 family GTP cyclohydrolase 1 type 2